MGEDRMLRAQFLNLLDGGNAHMSFEEALKDFPANDYNHRPPQVKYTFWHLLEHIRQVQHDILQFIRDPNYVSRPWPEGYWPGENELASQADWEETLQAIRASLLEIRRLVEDPASDLTAPLLHAPEYTLLREVLLVADHLAYHLGEFAILRQVVGNWPSQRKY